MDFLAPYFSFKELHSTLDDSLIVRHVAEPLVSCDSGDDAERVKAMMIDRNFDLVGVREHGQIGGYALRDELAEGKCGAFCRPFVSTEIVASQTPLIELLPLLKSKPAFFVLDRTQISGIVHRADLTKWPARMLLFSLVSLLEMYLLKMVRACYPGESFLTILNPKRADAVKKVFADRRQQDEDVDLADCLQFCDKAELLFHKHGLFAFLELPASKSGGRKYFKRMEHLRNRLAHAQDLVLGASWEEVVEVAESVQSFLRRCERKWDEFEAKFGQR
jgi:hypothetical protein